MKENWMNWPPPPKQTDPDWITTNFLNLIITLVFEIGNEMK